MVVTRHKFSTDDYHQMIEIGILTEDDRVELINGEIIKMAAVGSHHSACTKKSHTFFQRKLGEKVLVSVQDSIALEDGTEPEPDIALLVPRADFYAKGHPTPKDIFLVLEISDSSLLYDKEVKVVSYAKAGILETLLLDLTSQQLFVYREPTTNGYKTMLVLQGQRTVNLLAFPDVAVSMNDLLAPKTLKDQ